MQHQSEVALLLQKIREEYASARSGLTGLASGTSKHDVINQKVVRMHLYEEELIASIGEAAALKLIHACQQACDRASLGDEAF